MTEHAVVIAGGGPTGLMLAGELALAGVDVAIVERRASHDLAGSRAGGLHSRTIEVLDQRGIADRFLSQGQVAQVAGFSWIPLDISDFPTRHPYGLGLWQNHIERILAGWVGELPVTFYGGREVTSFAQDDTGVDVELADGKSLRAQYLVGCDGGRSVIRKAAGIDFPGWDPTTSNLIAEVELAEEPEWGIRRDDKGIRSLSKLADGERVRVMVAEQHLGSTSEPNLHDLGELRIDAGNGSAASVGATDDEGTFAMTVDRGLLALLEAKPGKGAELADFLKQGRELAVAETGTVTWYAFKLTETTYGIFDTFEGEDGRQAHLNGQIPAALGQVGPDLLASDPDIRTTDILAVK